MKISAPAALLFTLYALAAPAQQPLSALPSAPFQPAGNWNCEGTFRGNKAHKAAFSTRVILDGKWLEIDERDVEPATGYVATYLIGYNSTDKVLVEFDANNYGAAVYTSAAGWESNALTMTSTTSAHSQAPYIADQFTYAITAPDLFTVDWQIQRTAGAGWIAADHLACKRS
ncbi:MAG TPA: hypothetical protein VKV02_13950 [Acidobacteriaceae bacterium]|nr:hypothetical protein [Acidobacteriaceae bacterium]